MPRPKLQSSVLFASPVPARTSVGSVCATAIAPIDNVSCVSVKGIQLWPPSNVFQTPPPAAAIQIVLSSVGCAATPAIRPLLTKLKSTGEVVASGEGPMEIHAVVLSACMRASGAYCGCNGGGGVHGSTAYCRRGPCALS